MKSAKLIAILLITALLINFLSADAEFFSLPEVLPFCGGHAPSWLYDIFGAGSLILLCFWGLSRLSHQEQADEDDTGYEYSEEQDDEDDTD